MNHRPVNEDGHEQRQREAHQQPVPAGHMLTGTLEHSRADGQRQQQAQPDGAAQVRHIKYVTLQAVIGVKVTVDFAVLECFEAGEGVPDLRFDLLDDGRTEPRAVDEQHLQYNRNGQNEAECDL